MRFLCECGAEIKDQDDALPFKAHLMPDENFFGFLDHLRDLLDRLVSVDDGRGATATVQVVPFRNKLQREMSLLVGQSFRHLYQCPECGRLHIDSLDGKHGFSFKPEAEDTPRNLLQSFTPPD
ncbi:hypothetical protein DAETH_26640 [Deinococcus aetherius]|uniref:Uncharacterized protein n=1 Tax=Deinococcus aetherius TaxID=200252 RepID=A0ABM8AG74_9DEIO|nr:hypothetical protein DAETH_26640 [Deinococcus aetherius]